MFCFPEFCQRTRWVHTRLGKLGIILKLSLMSWKIGLLSYNLPLCFGWDIKQVFDLTRITVVGVRLKSVCIEKYDLPGICAVYVAWKIKSLYVLENFFEKPDLNPVNPTSGRQLVTEKCHPSGNRLVTNQINKHYLQRVFSIVDLVNRPNGVFVIHSGSIAVYFDI